MHERRSPDPSRARSRVTASDLSSPRPIVLWRLQGATDVLRGLACETSFGYALGLELDAELILLHLQPTLDCLVAYADRIEAALVEQGWTVIDDRSTRKERP
jgi:hypothetical protein